MEMGEFKRPAGFGNGHRDDPEEQYRAGYQHGAQRVLDELKAGTKDLTELEHWIETDLQKWRHDRNDKPEVVLDFRPVCSLVKMDQGFI